MQVLINIEIKEVEFYMEEVLFATPVRQEFIEQYEYVADFFYNNKSKLKEPVRKYTTSEEQISEKAEKVVSILDAMAKKDKGPVH